MPIYEFRCNGCRTVTNVFVRSFSAAVSPVCSKCGGSDLARLVSRPFLLRSSMDRMEGLDIEGRLGRLEDPEDPVAVARWAREMGGELGDELGSELREMAESVESGEDTYEESGGDLGYSGLGEEGSAQPLPFG